MPVSTAERNRRKRQRKRQAKTEQEESNVKISASVNEDSNNNNNNNSDDDVTVEIEYVAEPMFASAAAAAQPEALEVLQRFNERAAVASIVTDDESNNYNRDTEDAVRHYDYNSDDNDAKPRSKRKLREMLRPSVAQLKRRVQRPDLVEAHDVTAPDPEFLLELKATTGISVPVPRHWGRKRKYLQNKRGFQKPPFQLPDFLVATGITELRDSIAESEANQSVRQKNRQRVAPKMGAMDVDYKVLYDAFFKHQTKPTNLTKFGDVYYEGKELEVQKFKPGMPLSKTLRDALGMTTPSTPPPWLWNMQRYGPPPSYPGLKIPGLNAPLPTPECQYGFHPGGWGKPPVDAYGRLIYGGNPSDPPGSGTAMNDGANDGLDANGNPLVTNDGKTLPTGSWGALPMGEYAGQADNDDASVEEDSDEMEESDEEEEQSDVVEYANGNNGGESVIPPPLLGGPIELRKPGDETPMSNAPKQLYQVVQQQQADSGGNAVFSSDVKYVVPVAEADGIASVLSKATTRKQKKKADDDDDDDDELQKNFKF